MRPPRGVSQEKRLRMQGKLQAVRQKVRRFWADHSELSQFADRFANRFLRVMKARAAAAAPPHARGAACADACSHAHTRTRCGRGARGEAWWKRPTRASTRTHPEDSLRAR